MGWITRNIPAPIVSSARTVLRAVTRQPQLGEVDWGDLRRTRPISGHFGTDRGGAVDRYYIEEFLESRKADIAGDVLEIGEPTYTRRFGEERVTRSEVLHVKEGNPDATIVADLANAPQIPDQSVDCVILAQTLQYLFDPVAAMATLHRILRPDGILLATVPGITQIATRSEWGPSWYWSFTENSLRRLMGEAFGDECVAIEARGNVLAATAQLYGLGAVELTPEELADTDPDYQVIITGRAVRGAEPA